MANTTVHESAITISHEEMDGSPRIIVGEYGIEGHRRLIVDWGDAVALACQLRGGVHLAGGLNVIRLPHRFPWSNRAFCTNVEVNPFEDTQTGGGAGVNPVATYEKAILEVTYEMSQGGPPADGADGGGDSGAYEVVVTETLEKFNKVLTYTNRGLFWDAGGTKPVKPIEAPVRIYRGMVWNYTRHKLSALPAAAFSLSDCVNNAKVRSRTYGYEFDIGTLLYDGCSPRLQRTADGGVSMEASFRMLHFPWGWNKFPIPGTGDLSTVYKTGGDAFEPYTPANFAPLLAVL